MGGLLIAGAAGGPASAAQTPTLPGEYFRKPNQLTPAGTLFDNICVRINGDVARLHVPQTVKPYSGVPVQVVWFYHGSGSDHNALDGGFKQAAAAMVDRGAVAICQTAGGTLYTNPTAVALQVAGYAYMAGLFSIQSNILRSTSGGGPLAIETYAGRLIPKIDGMYNVNAAYDLRAYYDGGGDGKLSVVAAFGDDPAAIDAANPTRYPQSAWTGTRMRIVVSQPSSTDQVVPPDQHGLALLAKAKPVAADATMRAHSNGHSTPSFSVPDFVDMVDRWSNVTPPAGDTVSPTAVITSPANKATVKGYVTIKVTATDNVGVVDVGIYFGSTRMLSLAQTSATDWSATIWSKSSQTPNGTYSITARAKDAAGNVGVSAPVVVTVAN
jgi:hypothetical protein